MLFPPSSVSHIPLLSLLSPPCPPDYIYNFTTTTTTTTTITTTTACVATSNSVPTAPLRPLKQLVTGYWLQARDSVQTGNQYINSIQYYAQYCNMLLVPWAPWRYCPRRRLGTARSVWHNRCLNVQHDRHSRRAVTSCHRLGRTGGVSGDMARPTAAPTRAEVDQEQQLSNGITVPLITRASLILSAASKMWCHH